MALTRAQLLMGNDSQGAVLPGEVQGVKQGAGILIATDGTISVDASSVVGLVKLNNASAFNGYVWPSVSGSQGQMLTKGTGNLLEWTNGGVFVSSTAPLNPEIGDLWFNCTVGELLVYEACTSGVPKWTSGSEGLPVTPSNSSASPAFVSGNGTSGNPYICSASAASTGGTIVVNRVTITNLAPFQFVTIVDLNAVANGGRFSASNNVADGSGVLVFDLLFTDSPTSVAGTVYTCALKVGSGSVYINAPVTLTAVFVLNSPGSISGTGQIGSLLTYTTGTAAGGAPPYTYTWLWKLASNDSTLQTNGSTYTPLEAQFGDAIYVTVTAQDNAGQTVSGSTADFGPISKPPFPNPTPPTIPTTIGGSSSFNWDGASTTLSSDGCLLFRVNSGSFNQGPTPVTSGDTVTTTWSNSAPGVCGNANSGTFIEGCLFNATSSACASLTIDRIPEAFTIVAATNVTPGTVVTSAPVTLTGNNAAAYLTVGGSSSGTNFQASIGGGAFVPVPSAPDYSLSILPGQTLQLKFTTGPVATTTYTFVIVAGDSTGNTSATFAATTGSSGFPTTQVTFPTAVNGTGSVGTSVAWGNGSTSISGTGCIEFSVDGGTVYTQNATAITDGVVLKTRYKAGATCADEATGQTIAGGITNNTFTQSTSILINRVPATFTTFGNLSNESTNSQYTSSSVTPSGYNAIGYVTLATGATLTNVKASVGGGAFTLIPAPGQTTLPIAPGQAIIIQGTTGATFTTSYSATVEIGVSGNVRTQTWTIDVGAAVPTVETPSITSPVNNSIGVGTAAGITFTSSAFVSRDGAGTAHAQSDWQTYLGPSVPIETSPITVVDITPAYNSGISRSMRFTGGQLFTKAFAAAGTSQKNWTWSSWVKKGAISTNQGLFVQGDVATDQINFQISNLTNQLVFTDQVNNVVVANLITTASFLNCSDWFHLLISVDTDSFIPTRRIRIFIDNQELTNFSTAIYYPQGTVTSMNAATTLAIGANGISSARTNYSNSYLAGVNFVDGQDLLPTSFGAFSGGVWIYKPYTGTYGDHGFELNFESQENPTDTTIGLDTSGNANNFTPTGITTTLSQSVIFDLASNPSTMDVLTVGGGGASYRLETDLVVFNVAYSMGGGGGGAVVESLAAPVYPGKPYNIVVGTGGVNQQFVSPNGLPSSFSTVTAYAGGVASGVGAGGYSGFFITDPSSFAGAPGIPGFGFPGGSSSNQNNGSGPNSAGGGGGAGGTGAGTTGGTGKLSSVSGTSVRYGGGGGGGSNSANPGCNGPANNGGPGGGGNGYSSAFPVSPNTPPCNSAFGSNGTDGLGGGGGGFGYGGGKGTVIINYPDSFPALSSIGSSLTFTTNTTGGKRIYTFTNSPTVYNASNGVIDCPVPGGTLSTGYGNEVSGNYNILDPNRGTLSVDSGGLRAYPNNTFMAGTTPMVNGKYYWECIQGDTSTQTMAVQVGVSNASAGAPVSSNTFRFNTATAQKVDNTGTATSYGSVGYYSDVIGVAFDADAGKIWFSKNGTWFNGGDPAAGTGPAFTGLTSGPYYVATGGTGAQVLYNFGQMPYGAIAPVGFGPVITNISQTTLTFTDGTNLDNMTAGDLTSQSGGGATGIISNVDLFSNQMTLQATTGLWLVGQNLVNDDISLPPGPPTTDPPNPLIYTLTAGVTGSAVALTSFTVAKPPLATFSTYYTRVRYRSDAPTTVSDWSNWNTATTGAMT